MFLDYEQKTGDDGLLRTHFTEPGRKCKVHTWEVADPDTGDGISVRALERDDVRLGDLPFKQALAFLTTAVFGVSHAVAFELDRGEVHRFQRNGWCPNHMHHSCSYSSMPPEEAQAIWSNLRDRFEPSDEDIWPLLIEELRHRVKR
jgi:hypothetical protein